MSSNFPRSDFNWCRVRFGALLVSVLTLPVLLLFARPWVRALKSVPDAGIPTEVEFDDSSFPESQLVLSQRSIGPPPARNAQITNVQILDFNQDGRQEILVCDARRGAVLLYSESPTGTWNERILGEHLAAPAHATVVDLDGDTDNDVIVSVLGDLTPSDERVGRVIWLEQKGDGFERHLLLDDVRRVADVQAGDLDADGDLDLAVAVFGYSIGEILWLENCGDGRFRDHQLLSAPGTIHVPLADYDGDGDLDIAAIVSQEDEEVWGFENLGGGKFRSRRLYFTFNFDVGSAGLVRADLDGDGDADLILPMGDNLEYRYSHSQSHHGCLWLENQGGWKFVPKRIATFGGAYAADAGDLDGDGDLDVVLVSMVHDWQRPDNASLIWLENDGRQNFTPRRIAQRPTHLTTVACGDLNGDGRDDIVAGVLKVTLGHRDSDGRVEAWFSGSGE